LDAREEPTKRKTRRLGLWICAALASSLFAAVAAQTPPPPDRDATLKAMHQLDFLLGDWRGSGWMQMEPQTRMDFQSRETLTSKLGGLIVTVESMHQGVTSGDTDSVTVLRNFGVISYDAQAKKYHFRSWLENGRSSNYDATVSEGRFEWGYPDTSGRVRYVVRIDDQGRWQETGETSADGTTWRQILAMTLSRIEAPESMRDTAHE
jgi:hypothetical protein